VDAQDWVISDDFLQAAIDYMQMEKEDCETLLPRILEMAKHSKEIDDTVVQSIKDGRISPEMASRWIRTKPRGPVSVRQQGLHSKITPSQAL
jgi:hypothetical protein